MPRKLKSKIDTGLTLSLLDLDGKKDGSVKLPKELFSQPADPRLLASYVRVYRANQRQGNASTKTRGEVTGSTRKIYRQKGTGRARHGDIKAPIFVGGGIVGGPKPKDASLSINKKQKRKALLGALTLRFKDKDVIGLSNNFLKITPKTKEFSTFLKIIGCNKMSGLLVLPKLQKNNLVLASRNIPEMTLADSRSLNAYEVLKHKKIFMIAESVAALKKHFLSKDETS